MHEKEEPKINCPTFLKQEPVIKSLTEKINQAKSIDEKAGFAEELLKEANVLIACQQCDKNKLDCKSCRFIANMRKRTAEMIIQARRLA